MKISSKSKCALRITVDIAENSTEAPVSLRDVSARQNISVKYLEQIATDLVRARLLHSVRGAQGGYHLANMQCSVGDVLRAVDGDYLPAASENDEPPQISAFWNGLHKTVEAYVNGILIADLAKRPTTSVNSYAPSAPKPFLLD